MRYLPLLMVSYALLTASGASGEDWAPALFATKSHDFGTIAAGAKAEYAFDHEERLREGNPYRLGAIELWVQRRQDPECHAAAVRDGNDHRQHQQRAICAGDRVRRSRSCLTVPRTQKCNSTSRSLFAVTCCCRQPASISASYRQGRRREKQLTVTRYGDPDWKLLDVTCGNPHLRASFEETARSKQEVTYRLKMNLDDQTPDGFLNEAVLLTTTDDDAMRVPVLVQGKIIPKIAVAPQDLFVGVVAPGETVTRQIVVRSDEPFQIIAITTECDCFEFTLPEKPVAKKLHIVPVKFKAAGQERGFNRVIRIQTDAGYTAQLVAHAGVKPN